MRADVETGQGHWQRAAATGGASAAANLLAGWAWLVGGGSPGGAALMGAAAGMATTWLLLWRAARLGGRRLTGRETLLVTTGWLLALWWGAGANVVAWEMLGWPGWGAVAAGAAVSAPVVILGLAWFARSSAVVADGAPWRRLALFAAVYVVGLRLLYGAGLDLLPQEAYYWMYSQHPGLSYLDHPPMVAWLIMAGTHFLVNEELGVRLMAMVCWVVASAVVVAGTRRWYGPAAGWVSLFLMATLPYFLVVGFMMTPDVPLVVCWAGYLYCAGRALIDRQGRWWWPAGACMGVGMLSKYSIALLGLATLVYVVMDKRSRCWLGRPETYLSAVLAVVLFSPVLVWNMRNEWASFAFQGARRWSGGIDVSIHLLVLALLLLATPIGAVAMTRLLWRGRGWGAEAGESERALARRRFALVFTLVPLAVFVAFSLQGAPRMNWTGPTLLAALPVLATAIASGEAAGGSWCRPGLWVKTWLVVALVFGGGMYWVLLGLPGIGRIAKLESAPVAWEEFGQTLEEIEDEVEAKTGHEPVLMGMDKYFLASQTAFYAEADDMQEEGKEGAVGRHLVGRSSLMYRFWCRPEQMNGCDVVLYDTDRDDVEATYLGRYFERLGPVETAPIRKNGRPLVQLYWRVGYGYRPAS